MQNKILTILLFFATAVFSAGAQTIYKPADSIRIERLLAEGLKQPKSTNLMIYYGMQFVNVPYVAHTLEVPYNTAGENAKEQLVINLDELDCTTFVETVLTLARTTQMGQKSFREYCRNLTNFRYQKGIVTDYTSRNHYFTTWIDNALSLGLIKEIGPADSPMFRSRVQQIDFMTKHRNLYAALRNAGGERYFKGIGDAEKIISRRVYYLPTSQLGKTQKELPFIQDGDILALETTKSGLDVSHLGIAVWGRDGKLHLLNASSIHKKVVLEPKTLQEYQQKRKTQIGIRILRPI